MNTLLILASTSPRRQELLRLIGVDFEVMSSDVVEDFEPTLSSTSVVELLAERKGAVIACKRPDAFVLAADTVVSSEGRILGKPNSKEEALSILQGLRGRTHQVVTGVAFLSESRGLREVFHVSTDVTFGDVSNQLLQDYVDSGEPLDKAGAYGIQGGGAVLVKSINGSYHNVVGLPVYEVNEVMRRYI